jgi:hypothetical protein
MVRSSGCSWEASREPQQRTAEAGGLSAEGVVLVCIQLLFLNDDLVEKTMGQPRFFEDVEPEYHARIGRMLGYIHRECLFLTYEGHPRDRVDIEAIPLYPEGRPWPEGPSDVINHIIDLVNVNPKTLQKARSVTPIVNVCDHIDQLIRFASGERPPRPHTYSWA